MLLTTKKNVYFIDEVFEVTDHTICRRKETKGTITTLVSELYLLVCVAVVTSVVPYTICPSVCLVSPCLPI